MTSARAPRLPRRCGRGGQRRRDAVVRERDDLDAIGRERRVAVGFALPDNRRRVPPYGLPGGIQCLLGLEVEPLVRRLVRDGVDERCDGSRTRIVKRHVFFLLV